MQHLDGDRDFPGRARFDLMQLGMPQVQECATGHAGGKHQSGATEARVVARGCHQTGNGGGSGSRNERPKARARRGFAPGKDQAGSTSRDRAATAYSAPGTQMA